jgi:mRNA interferase RelE/StbE
VAYQIEVSRRARKELAHLPQPALVRVTAVIDALAQDPRPEGCLPVRAAPKGTYRIRVGDYRVIYTVLDEEQAVVIARVVRRREDTYRGLK